MAFIRPFRAWRYNEEVISDVNRKFSPLFDVVSKEQLEALYEIPNNSIHVSVPKSDEEALNKLLEWKERKVIRQDPLPGIYVYYQKFSLFGEKRDYTRKGFVCMVKIDSHSGEAGSDIVLHEDTISSSVGERTRLLEKTLLNTAPTHGLYDDPDFALETIMDRYMQNPRYQYIDYQGVINQLAIIQDKRDIMEFVTAMKQRKIFLADGHHRLASSVALMKKESQSNSSLSDDSMVHYHLMYLTNLRSDDLRILPIHRTLTLDQPIQDVDEMLEQFRAYFSVREITHHRAPVYEEIKGSRTSFGVIIGDRHFVIQLKENFHSSSQIEIPLAEAVKVLPYTLLHYFVFDKIFGLPYKSQHSSDSIQYVKDYGIAIKSALLDKRCISFITNELSMADMMNVCNSGALMPQKSTYFYPKVICGLVFASIDDHENNSPFDLSFGFSQKT